MFFKSDIAYRSNKASVITPNGNVYSYEALYKSVQQIKDVIKKRSLIFCLCSNTIGSLQGYLAVIQGNHVGVMIDANMPIDQLHELIKKYRPSYIWSPKDHVVALSDHELKMEQEGYQLLATKEKFPPKLYSKLSLLLPTSGSTGSSKFVRLTQQNLEANAVSIAKYLKINAEERPVTSLPMHYSYGLSVINSHLIKGATLLLTTDSIMEKEFWRFLEDEKATSLSGVPYTYQMLRRLGIMKRNYPYLKTLTQAGGKLNNQLIKEFDEYCLKNEKQFIVMYGQTEATARISYLPSGSLPHKEGSVGIAIPGGNIEIHNENGMPQIHTEVGELIYSGENVALGYAECGEDLKKGDEFNGVLHTGDIARKDEDGFVYIVGRQKRFLKIFGNRVNLDEIESHLKTVTPEVACGGKDDKLMIYFTDENDEPLLKQKLKEVVQLHRSAIRVQRISHIPKNEAGKVLYAELERENVV